jgi:Fe-S-cluster containining protein
MTLADGDAKLVQIVDAAFAEAARRSGPWLVCRPGCTQCCYGSFAISPLDAWRLKQGLADLESKDPDRARRVRERARNAPDGTDGPDDNSPCPALDPAGGTCDLYAARPITCRVFGPPARCGEEAIGVCELCYEGATDEQIAACEVEIDTDNLEGALLDMFEPGETTVAEALRQRL